MPASYSSPARNLFLLGSTGAQLVTNFFKQIDESASSNFFHTPSEIRYFETDDTYLIGGEGDRNSPASEKYGWIERRQQNGTKDWSFEVSSTLNLNTSLRALEVDGSKFIAVGKTGTVPWIARYNTDGTFDWQSTTNSGDVEYNGIAVDSNNKYYACGNTNVSGESVAFVESFDSSGNPGWGKTAIMLGRDVVLNKISANSRGEVVSVGYLEDDSSNKGYIIKINTNTGEVLWDRTLEFNTPLSDVEVTGITTDPYNDDIFICGNIKEQVISPTIQPSEGFIIKYTPEGNIAWQSQTNRSQGTSAAVFYEDITITNGIPTVFGYARFGIGNGATLISRFAPNGDLIWRREIDEGNSFDPRNASIDSDQSFIYLVFNDPADTETYVYGKVSTSGNGLGDFEYDDGTGAPLLNYIRSTGPNGSNIGEKIGTLSDGSIRNDTSDFVTYPYTATRLLFDDLATPVANKRRQMDSADSFEYSGSPAIRITDFMELDLGDESFDVTVPAAEAVYEEAGTYTFTVPAGVTEVSAVVVGSGGGAASSPGANAQAGGGGGGGGLAYGTFTVTPGEDLTIVVGNFGVGGASGTTAGTAGESTTISRGATVLLEGGGGAGGQADAPAQGQSGSTASGGTSSGTERDGGGSGGTGGTARYNWGGGGGGGAGGYTGNGGNAGNGNNTTGDGLGLPGSGGGGGGGGGQANGGTQNNGGGGVGLFGGPINGAGGTNGNPGSGGSNGQGGQPGGKGGKFGGGGGGGEDDTNTPGGDGGTGGARIIWGAGRSFPNSAAQDFSSVETRVRDKSGKGNNGVVNGATLNAAGYWEFDGVDDYIKVGIDPTDDYSNFTVEVWFNPASVSNYENVLDCNFNTSWVSGNVGPRLEMYATGRLTWLFSDDITNNQVNSQFDVVSGDPGDEISNGNWYHCAITFDGSGGAVYLNGEQTRTTPSSTNGSATGGEFHGFFTDVRLGNGFHLSGNTERLFTGNIGEVRFYPRALTAAQVFQNYNSTKSKYINEAPDTAPKISNSPIVYDSNLLLNYDFGNRATYDRAENLFKNNSFIDRVDYNSTPNGNFTFSKGPTNSTVGPEILSPVGDLTGGTIVYDGSDASAGGVAWSYRDTTLPDQNQIQFVDGDVVTYSVYAKIGSSNNTVKGIYLRTYSPETAHAFFLDSGTKAAGFNENNASPPSGASAAIEDVGNGWYRCSITLNITANDEIGFQLYLTNAGGATGFNDPAGAGDTIHAWGAQVERNSSAGRPIKTSGTAITAPTTVKNLSSSSYNGELKGAVIIGGGFSYPTFNPDGYFDFDPADNQYIDITTLAPLADTSAVTMEAWVNVDTLTNTYQVIGTWERTTNHWQFTYSGDTNYGLSFGVAGSNDSVGITGSPATGSWQHVVATWNGGSLTTLSDWAIYVNGVAQTIQLTGATGTAGNDSYIGTRQGLAASNMLDGKMGEIRYYSRALSATEVSQNFNATRAKYGV